MKAQFKKVEGIGVRRWVFALAALGAVFIVPAFAQAQARGTAGGSKAAAWNRYSQNYGPGHYVEGSYVPHHHHQR
ncbi:MAG: hypothetical protein AB7K24_09310 [Gemmataceae bacterium]